MSSGMRGMMMRGRTAGAGTPDGLDMWTMMGLRLVLAGADGQVVLDSDSALAGKLLPPDQLSKGTPVINDGRTVGTVIVSTVLGADAASPAGEFLAAVNRSILWGALLAGGIALALGALFFTQLVAPIRRLTAAAHAIAAGDLTRRVSVSSGDELGELARAFNKMAGDLSRAEEGRRHMVADIAHELRTPLTVMQANLEAMQDGVLPTDAEQLASLREETLLLSRLVADLRLLSLAEAGQLRLERAEVDLPDLVRRAVERMRPPAAAKGIILATSVPNTRLTAISADPARVSQVLGNLLENALRYAGEGTTVCVTVATYPGGAIAPNGREAQPEAAHYAACGRSIVISVTDPGPGIPSDDLSHVFDRFYRADKSRSRASGGSGLGLAIVKHLVEAHGGRVWVESPVFEDSGGHRHGTRVSFCLPQ
jgi:signal transduction histidine kinase